MPICIPPKLWKRKQIYKKNISVTNMAAAAAKIVRRAWQGCRAWRGWPWPTFSISRVANRLCRPHYICPSNHFASWTDTNNKRMASDEFERYLIEFEFRPLGVFFLFKSVEIDYQRKTVRPLKALTCYTNASWFIQLMTPRFYMGDDFNAFLMRQKLGNSKFDFVSLSHVTV